MEENQIALEKTKLGPLARLWGVITSPTRAFAYLRDNPTWLLPFLIVAIALTLFSWRVAPLSIEEGKKRIMQSERIPDEKKEEIIQKMEESQGANWKMLFVPIVFLLTLAVQAGVFYFGASLLLGGEGSFRQVFSTCSYANFVTIPALVIKAPLILAKNTLHIQTSLALVLPTEASKNLLYRFLGHFDFFQIWILILVSIGISEIYGFKLKKSAGMVFSWWLLWIILSLALSSLVKVF